MIGLVTEFIGFKKVHSQPIPKLNSGCQHDRLFSVDFLILETFLKQFFKEDFYFLRYSYFYYINFDAHIDLKLKFIYIIEEIVSQQFS